MIDIDYNNSILSDSICTKCDRLLVRVITPLDPEDMGLDEATIESLGLDEEETIEAVFLICLEDNSQMDYIVKECNKFKPKNRRSIIRNEDSFIWCF